MTDWHLHAGDSLDYMRSFPDRFFDLVFFSPPYEDARLYAELKFKIRGQKWVDWLRPYVAEACRVSNGLVCVNAAGKVRHHRYSPIMEYLTTDLARMDGIVMGPSPYAWVKASGIPGSGSKVSGYHRRNWEPIYCYALPDRLPLAWHDHLAFGKPPKWAPGGEMSNRMSSGERVNQWGGRQNGDGSRRRNGKKQSKVRPSHVVTTVVEANGHIEGRDLWGMSGGSGMRREDGKRRTHGKKATYCGRGKMGDLQGTMKGSPASQPAIANPGNVIKTNVGGNHLGHKAAHTNEAPMPLDIPERFVLWFARPGKPVLDPMMGSGTTIHAAFIHGRIGYGCDLRPSQVELTEARLRTLTRCLA